MEPWSDEQVWAAVDAWRWAPPTSRHRRTDNYDLYVTPGSYALTYAYGLHARDEGEVPRVLRDLRSDVERLGGSGVRVQWTPRDAPAELPQLLEREGYRAAEETEVLVWELRDAEDRPQLPAFPPPPGISVREVRSEEEYSGYHRLTATIFGDPAPSAESLEGFLKAFRERIRRSGHSDRYLAWSGIVPVGLGGLELVDRVARFFGSGVLPEYRRRGVYGSLVRTRCVDALARGAEIALVTARVGTSGPVLKAHGFRTVGSVRVFEARWSA